jgi:betaine-aldehyde dehydrogenase
MKIGDPRDPATQVGALISAEHMHRVLAAIEGGKRSARLVCGGNRVTRDGLDRGNFVEPTIFADCTDDIPIVTDEIFGPVMSVLKVQDRG